MQAESAAGARTLVLIHAFPVGVRLFEPQLSAFPGWQVITPSLSGFDGNGLAGEASADAYARHVLGELDKRRIERAVIGGVSMGGYITFGVVRQAPDRVRGVILADTRSTADTADAREGRERMLRTVLGPDGEPKQSGPAAIAAEMLPKLLGKTTQTRRPDIVRRVKEMIEGQTPEGLAAAIRVLMSRPDSTPLLSRMTAPALVIVGDEDTLTPPSDSERMAAEIPRATLVTIPEAGHLANLEAPQAFNAAVSRFLDEVQRL
jgi:pimeloyl-ACP methyl ester carboxylesterase